MLTQDNRFIKIKTPLGENVLLVSRMEAREGLSMPFSVQLDLISTESNIDFRAIVGQKLTISLALSDGERFFNGIVSRFAQNSGMRIIEEGYELVQYSATLVPWFWLLSRSSDSRIFQNQSIPKIIEQIFSKSDFKAFNYAMNLHGTYDPKEYCVQYHETDFNFVSRLLEQEGIFYFFEHEDGDHTMILADSPQEHQPCPRQARARCRASFDEGLAGEDAIETLNCMQEIMSGKYTVNDYNFQMPSTSLKVDVPSIKPLGPGELELYDHPGEYKKRAEGERVVNIRMQAEEAKITTITGSSTCRAFSSGYRFVLDHDFADDLNNKPYTLVSVTHWAAEPLGSSGDEVKASYANSFTCIPWDVPYRPQQITPKPMIAGAQTATVVGPPGEEIYTEEHGRVKVQFHWDRLGNKDDQSSCWIRVGQLMAGSGWGGVFIPRIGQEVIVHFLEGDPDRPIIAGCVYNAENAPPYPLPGEKTKSTLKSNSSIGGGGFNEFRFEDKKGQEEIFLHGQKDWTINILNNKNETVGINTTETIGVAKELTIGALYQVSVGGAMNESIGATKSEEIGVSKQVVVGRNLTESVSKDMTVSVGKNMSFTIDENYTLDAKKKINIVAEDQITLKTGSASITMKKNGDIVIKGNNIKIQGSGDVILKGAKIAAN